MDNKLRRQQSIFILYLFLCLIKDSAHLFEHRKIIAVLRILWYLHIKMFIQRLLNIKKKYLNKQKRMKLSLIIKQYFLDEVSDSDF